MRPRGRSFLPEPLRAGMIRLGTVMYSQENRL